jgi:hypothetical protein
VTHCRCRRACRRAVVALGLGAQDLAAVLGLGLCTDLSSRSPRRMHRAGTGAAARRRLSYNLSRTEQGASTARLNRRPVDSRDIEVSEVGGVVRDERCPEPPRESGDQQVGVVVRPPVSTAVRPEPRRLQPHGPVVVDPLKHAGEGVQLLELTIRPAVTQAAPQPVEDDWDIKRSSSWSAASPRRASAGAFRRRI